MQIGDLTGLGQPLTKLIEVVSAGVGNIYKPTQFRKMALAKADEIRILERAKTDAELDRAFELSAFEEVKKQLLPSVTDDLVNRAKNRLLRQEVNRQINIDRVVEEAVKAMPNDSVSTEPLDQTWITRFFSAASDVSEQQMQTLWGKVLAGETSQPGRFSGRSLDVLRNLSPIEAETFATACSLVTGLNHYIIKIPTEKKGMFILEDTEALAKLGFSHNNFITLVDAGLLHPESTLLLTYKMQEKPIIFMNNGRRFQVEATLNNNEIKELIFNTVNFTEAGQQLGTLVPNNFQENYFYLLASRYLHHGINMRLID